MTRGDALVFLPRKRGHIGTDCLGMDFRWLQQIGCRIPDANCLVALLHFRCRRYLFGTAGTEAAQDCAPNVGRTIAYNDGGNERRYPIEDFVAWRRRWRGDFQLLSFKDGNIVSLDPYARNSDEFMGRLYDEPLPDEALSSPPDRGQSRSGLFAAAA